MEDNIDTLADSNQISGLSIHSGFPNPADDHYELGLNLSLDLNQLLVRRPSSTYLFRISGHQWSDQGIFDGDVAIIDRHPALKPSDLVVIWDNGNFKLIRQHTVANEVTAWGKITAVIHQYI